MKNLHRAFAVLSLSALAFACGENRHFAVNNSPTPTPEKTAETFEQRLDVVQQQGFDFVYVFRRKDGGALNVEDKKFLREKSPLVNQWVVTEDGKTAIAGTNYQFPPEELKALRERFNVEDHSKPKEEPKNEEANVNKEEANVNK
jgi:hypothetical protein